MDDPEKRKGCDWPDCGSWFSNKALIDELKAVQENQKSQINVQERMLAVQLEAAKIAVNLHHLQEDQRIQDKRITEAFRRIGDMPQTDAIIPKEKLLTKDDFIKLIAYTSAVVVAVYAIIKLIFPNGKIP